MWRVDDGDCREVMARMEPESVTAIVTDPPYMIGAVSVGNSKAKAGQWEDMLNSGYWFAAWIAEGKRVLRRDGFLFCFGNWRSIPTLIHAASIAKFQVTSCMVWDKEWIGPAAVNQFRPRYEVILVFAREDAEIKDRSAPDIIQCKWLSAHMRETEHPAEKPVELIRRLIQHAAPNGGIILDPFAGSGTTGCAAVLENCDFIGIELNPEYARIARARIAHWENAGAPLAIPKRNPAEMPGTPLFGDLS